MHTLLTIAPHPTAICPILLSPPKYSKHVRDDLTTSADSVRTVVLQNEPREGGSTNGADINGVWAFVQLYDFNGITTDTFDVVYNDDDTVTVAYDDDLTDSVALSLDRANAPQGGMVHLTISDTRLNLDPTGSDEWILDTNHTEGDTVPNARYDNADNTV